MIDQNKFNIIMIKIIIKITKTKIKFKMKFQTKILINLRNLYQKNIILNLIIIL